MAEMRVFAKSMSPRTDAMRSISAIVKDNLETMIILQKVWYTGQERIDAS